MPGADLPDRSFASVLPGMAIVHWEDKETIVRRAWEDRGVSSTGALELRTCRVVVSRRECTVHPREEIEKQNVSARTSLACRIEHEDLLISLKVDLEGIVTEKFTADRFQRVVRETKVEIDRLIIVVFLSTYETVRAEKTTVRQKSEVPRGRLQ